MELKDRLKELRLHKSLSQVALAEQLGVSKSLIGAYETGDRKPSYEMLTKLADYFRVSADYLTGLDQFEADDFADLVSHGYSIDEASLRTRSRELYYGKKMMALSYDNREIAETLIDKLLATQGVDSEALRYEDILADLTRLTEAQDGD
jgi:transcriptional regulator with XRE-family HTH domain